MRKLFLLLLLCPLLLQAQDRKAAKAEERRQAREVVDVIREGGIVIRLTTNARKIERMQELLDNGSLTSLNRQRLEARIKTTIEETQAEQEMMVELMRQEYDLGPVYFIHDTTLVLLNSGALSGYFLNNDLEVDPEITRPEDFLIGQVGYTDAATTARAEALMLTDREQLPLPAPFPNAITFNNLGYAFNKTLAPDMADRRRLEGMIQRLRSKLASAMNDLLESEGE